MIKLGCLSCHTLFEPQRPGTWQPRCPLCNHKSFMAWDEQETSKLIPIQQSEAYMTSQDVYINQTAKAKGLKIHIGCFGTYTIMFPNGSSITVLTKNELQSYLRDY